MKGLYLAINHEKASFNELSDLVEKINVFFQGEFGKAHAQGTLATDRDVSGFKGPGTQTSYESAHYLVDKSNPKKGKINCIFENDYASFFGAVHESSEIRLILCVKKAKSLVKKMSQPIPELKKFNLQKLTQDIISRERKRYKEIWSMVTIQEEYAAYPLC